MNIRTRILSLLLAISLFFALTACKSSGDQPETPTSTPSETPGFVVDTSVEDLCLATAGVAGDSVLFTVNGAPVTTRAYLYWLSYSISYLESMGYSMDWDNNPTLADFLKEDAMASAAQYALIADKAKQLGCNMTEEQINELETNLTFTIMTMGGEEVFHDELRKAGLDYDTFYSISAASYYFAQLREHLFADRPTADEMADYIEENDILYAKHILVMTVDPTTRQPLDDATIAEKKSAAESILSQLQNSTDLAADFDALMFEHSEDTGLISNPDGYIFTAGEMVAEFENATRALEFGQISGLVESTFGYHIILRQDPANSAVADEVRSALLQDQLQAWMDEADIVPTDAYETLDVPSYHKKLSAYQKAFLEEASAVG